MGVTWEGNDEKEGNPGKTCARDYFTIKTKQHNVVYSLAPGCSSAASFH